MGASVCVFGPRFGVGFGPSGVMFIRAALSCSHPDSRAAQATDAEVLTSPKPF